MLPPQFVGDQRLRLEPIRPPDWFIRDMGERLHRSQPKRRWRFPIWPGLRLELRILSANGADHV